jgi:hypothetical protein
MKKFPKDKYFIFDLPGQVSGGKEVNLPDIRIFPTDVRFLPLNGTMLTDVRTENTDVREVGFYPPQVSQLPFAPESVSIS